MSVCLTIRKSTENIHVSDGVFISSNTLTFRVYFDINSRN
jgi:hypothetical protein